MYFLSLCVPPIPGINPRLISGWPNLASEEAIIKSVNKQSSNPPPKACPSTNEIIGSLIFSILSKLLNNPFNLAD